MSWHQRRTAILLCDYEGICSNLFESHGEMVSTARDRAKLEGWSIKVVGHGKNGIKDFCPDHRYER